MTSEELATTTLSIPVNVTRETTTGDEIIPIILQIEVRGGEVISIKGQGETNMFIGTLSLVPEVEGGDECYRCDPKCHVVDCPA